MNAKLSFDPVAQIETECLAVAVLDEGSGKDPKPVIVTDDADVKKAVADLLSSGEVTGKIFETVMIHHPQGVKARRLLLVGGGKAKNFSAYELRKVAGTAVRFLKPKSIRTLAFIAPPSWSGEADQSVQSRYIAERRGSAEAVKAIVEGAYIADFDPDVYRSDRKDQRMNEITVVASGTEDRQALERALAEGRII